MYVIRQEELPYQGMSRAFIGQDHENVGISFFMVDAEPGGGPRLHKHPYPEVIIVLQGQATCVAGDEQRELRAGDIVVVGANQPHRFVNTRDGPLRQIDIHLSSRFITEWLESPGD